MNNNNNKILFNIHKLKYENQPNKKNLIIKNDTY